MAAHYFRVLIGIGVSPLRPNDEPRYRLYVDGGTDINLLGDRHVRGGQFPSLPEDGWSEEDVTPETMVEIMRCHARMQAYFDEHFNGGIERRGKVKKIQCNADKKTGGRAIKKAKR